MAVAQRFAQRRRRPRRQSRSYSGRLRERSVRGHRRRTPAASGSRPAGRQLRPFFKSVDVGRRGEISVLHPNGAVLFREPSASDAIGEPAVDDPILPAARQSPNGTLRHTLASHGAPVLTAFRTTANPPLIVSVSLSEDDLLAQWWREVVNSLGAFGVFSLIAIAGA